MKPESQRIAIAEACGWKWFRIRPPTAKPQLRSLLLSNMGFGEADMSEKRCNLEWMWINGRVPDYLNDLNAMHEAALTLTEAQRAEYCSILVDVANADVDFKTVEASAAQRAEAFLRATGRWVES